MIDNIVNKILNGENLTQSELKYFVDECEINFITNDISSEYSEITSICKYKDKRFIVHWREYFNSNYEDVTSYCKNIYNQPIIVNDYKSYPLSRYIHNYYNSNGNIIYSYINDRENDE